MTRFKNYRQLVVFVMAFIGFTSSVNLCSFTIKEIEDYRREILHADFKHIDEAIAAIQEKEWLIKLEKAYQTVQELQDIEAKAEGVEAKQKAHQEMDEQIRDYQDVEQILLLWEVLLVHGQKNSEKASKIRDLALKIVKECIKNVESDNISKGKGEVAIYSSGADNFWNALINYCKGARELIIDLALKSLKSNHIGCVSWAEGILVKLVSSSPEIIKEVVTVVLDRDTKNEDIIKIYSNLTKGLLSKFNLLLHIASSFNMETRYNYLLAATQAIQRFVQSDLLTKEQTTQSLNFFVTSVKTYKRYAATFDIKKLVDIALDTYEWVINNTHDTELKECAEKLITQMKEIEKSMQAAVLSNENDEYAWIKDQPDRKEGMSNGKKSLLDMIKIATKTEDLIGVEQNNDAVVSDGEEIVLLSDDD